MDEIAQYRDYADKCRSLAATAKTPEHKTQLLEMAAEWDTVARRKKSELAKTADDCVPEPSANGNRRVMNRR